MATHTKIWNFKSDISKDADDTREKKWTVSTGKLMLQICEQDT